MKKCHDHRYFDHDNHDLDHNHHYLDHDLHDLDHDHPHIAHHQQENEMSQGCAKQSEENDGLEQQLKDAQYTRTGDRGDDYD